MIRLSQSCNILAGRDRGSACLPLPVWRSHGPMVMRKEKIRISGGRTLIYYRFSQDGKKTGEKKLKCQS